MRPFVAHRCTSSLNAVAEAPLSATWTFVAVTTLLSIHAGLLAYSATRHSPTHLEPAFLASGVGHWQLRNFDLYCVNPPLPRMIAACPVLAAGCLTDWSAVETGPGSRPEFVLGEDFVEANGLRSIPLFCYARWACIPFSLVGGFFAFQWSRELYGNRAGLLSLFLWTFEPNLLGHAELVTPDCACWSLGIVAGYTFWRWLDRPTWGRALWAGAALGLAEATKFSWIILVALWPLLWLLWRVGNRRQLPHIKQPSLGQLSAMLLFAGYIVNSLYLFDGSGTPLKDYAFVSAALSGHDDHATPGNRFARSFLGQIPVPLPRPYVQGCDLQRKDLERYDQPSYLNGVWKQGGWWHYYLYGLAIKVPCGIWALAGLVLSIRLLERRPVVTLREAPLLVPPLVLLYVVSSCTTFNHHLRYVFPCIAFLLVWVGQVASPMTFKWTTAQRTSPDEGGLSPRWIRPAQPVLVFLCSAYIVGSSLAVYPHHLAYFNEFVGGPKNGWRHLLGSSVDWGQDLYFARDILHGLGATPDEIRVISYGPVASRPLVSTAPPGQGAIGDVIHAFTDNDAPPPGADPRCLRTRARCA